MNFNRLAILVILAGCGINVRHSGQGEVIHKIDLSEIEKYFDQACREEFPFYSEEEIEACVVDYVTGFLESVAENE